MFGDRYEDPTLSGLQGKVHETFTSLKLLQLKATHHLTERCFKDLLVLLKDMLPNGSKIPKTTYEAKQNICPLGLEVEKYMLVSDCILFRGDHAKLTKCLECGAPRFKRRKDGGDEERSHGAPQKVAWYFPIIPRLRRLFASSRDAQLLCWHKKPRKKDDYIRHPADSTQWHVIDFLYKDFAEDPRNLRFALSTDGMYHTETSILLIASGQYYYRSTTSMLLGLFFHTPHHMGWPLTSWYMCPSFLCHQQPSCSLECGFYTAHHMAVTFGLLNVNDPKFLKHYTGI